VTQVHQKETKVFQGQVATSTKDQKVRLEIAYQHGKLVKGNIPVLKINYLLKMKISLAQVTTTFNRSLEKIVLSTL